MEHTPTTAAAERIEQALSRLETAVARAQDDSGLPARHRRLRAAVADNVEELDAVIAELAR